ncbi:hypothetical protein GCM10022287_33150 [Gryllotalpicola koreensis]|uniref:Uncharacterized protein n=1 Tax=Gryllotalpicola koreensis TaxID=993086 RepID=A0ABP8A910_9MICO
MVFPSPARAGIAQRAVPSPVAERVGSTVVRKGEFHLHHLVAGEVADGIAEDIVGVDPALGGCVRR